MIPTKEHCVVPMKQLHHVPKSAKIMKNCMKWVAVWSFFVKIRRRAASRPARSLWKRSRPLKRPPGGPKGPKVAQGAQGPLFPLFAFKGSVAWRSLLNCTSGTRHVQLLETALFPGMSVV